MVSPVTNNYPVTMQIRSEETELIGRWELNDGVVHVDAVSTRIEELTRTFLTKVAVSGSGWETLYRDPADNRLWELSYPNSERHGGGPPSLKVLSLLEAKSKYAI
jgi:hypothetical protein